MPAFAGQGMSRPTPPEGNSSQSNIQQPQNQPSQSDKSLEDMPNEVLLKIFSNLNSLDLSHAACASKRFKQVAEEDSRMKFLIHRINLRENDPVVLKGLLHKDFVNLGPVYLIRDPLKQTRPFVLSHVSPAAVTYAEATEYCRKMGAVLPTKNQYKVLKSILTIKLRGGGFDYREKVIPEIKNKWLRSQTLERGYPYSFYNGYVVGDPPAHTPAHFCCTLDVPKEGLSAFLEQLLQCYAPEKP